MQHARAALCNEAMLITRALSKESESATSHPLHPAQNPIQAMAMQSGRAWTSSLVTSERRPRRAASVRGGDASTATRTFFPEVERARYYYVKQNALFVTLLFLVVGVVVRATVKDGEDGSLWGTAGLVGHELWDLAFGVDWPGQPRRHGLRYFLSTEYWSAALFGSRPDGSSPQSLFNPSGRGVPQAPRTGLLPALALGVYNSLPSWSTVMDATLRAGVVSAGIYVFAWGVKVGGGVPRLWELRLAFKKLVDNMEGRTEETTTPAAKATSGRSTQPTGAATPARKAPARK